MLKKRSDKSLLNKEKNRMRISLLVFSILLMTVSCMKQRSAPQAEPPITQRSERPVTPIVTDTMLYYSRGACYGMCPIFEFTVMKDGRAVYIGKNHVDRIGRFQAVIKHSDIAPVLQKANEIGYFELNAVYDNEGVQDLPNIITGIAHNGKLHLVRNRYKGPTALRMLYLELDSLIAKQSWNPTTVIKQD
jgi:hypothetical protein